MNSSSKHLTFINLKWRVLQFCKITHKNNYKLNFKINIQVTYDKIIVILKYSYLASNSCLLLICSLPISSILLNSSCCLIRSGEKISTDCKASPLHTNMQWSVIAIYWTKGAMYMYKLVLKQQLFHIPKLSGWVSHFISKTKTDLSH